MSKFVCKIFDQSRRKTISSITRKKHKLCTRTISVCKAWTRKNSLELLMTRNKNSFFKSVRKNIASESIYASRLVDVDSLNDFFANIEKSLASSSIYSILEQMTITKSIDKTVFLYPTEAHEV